MNNHGIKYLAEEDRPREKLLEKGADSLSNAELLAILIGSGTTRQSSVELMRDVMNLCDNKFTLLSRMSVPQLMEFNGIGLAKAVTIKAAAEIGRRRTMETSADIRKISSGEDAYQLMYPVMRDLSTEEFWAILLNNNSRLIKRLRLSSGGITSTMVDQRILLKEALLADATQFIVCHNHPSGSLKPSRDDIRLTETISQAAKTMNIRLLDHLIITDGNYYSFLENGKL